MPVEWFALEKGGSGHAFLLPIHLVPGNVT